MTINRLTYPRTPAMSNLFIPAQAGNQSLSLLSSPMCLMCFFVAIFPIPRKSKLVRLRRKTARFPFLLKHLSSYALLTFVSLVHFCGRLRSEVLSLLFPISPIVPILPLGLRFFVVKDFFIKPPPFFAKSHTFLRKSIHFLRKNTLFLHKFTQIFPVI